MQKICVLPGCLNRVDRGSAYCSVSCYTDDTGYKYALHAGLYLSNGSTGPPFTPGLFCVDESYSCPPSPVIGTMYEAASEQEEKETTSSKIELQNLPEKDDGCWVVKGEQPAASGVKRKSLHGNPDKYKTTHGGGKQTSVTTFFARDN